MEILKSWLKYGTVGTFEKDVGVNASSCSRHKNKFGLFSLIVANTSFQSVSYEQCRGFQSIMSHITTSCEMLVQMSAY